MNKQSYPYIAYAAQRGKIEIVACSEHRFRLIYDGNFVAAFRTRDDAIRYMNREFFK
jgi:hypothetical protein